MKKAEVRCAALMVVFLLVVIAVVLFLRETGLAERLQEECWILCQPDSCVTLRSGAGKNKPEFGACQCGDKLWTDNMIRNGFIHVLEVPAEESEGWISNRYVIMDKPEEMNQVMQIRADGRVACRKWIGGPVKAWIMPGDQLTVWWMSESWAVTSRGYIKSEFLEAAP